MAQMPPQYYQRYDPNKNYEEHLFLAGKPLQSAEFNELQKNSAYRLKSVADALFRDGDIVRDAQISVNEDTGAVVCESGAVYIAGAVRGVPTASFTIPVAGTIAVGVRLIETVVTSLEDPELLDPAVGTRAYNEPGASRLKIEAVWGWDSDEGAGEFFPVHSVVDGILSAKEAPPNLDSVTQALARYDRDSAGGTYVVSGLTVSRLADNVEGQVYSISEGRARVNGYGIDFTSSRRMAHTVAADLRTINNEPKTSTTDGSQRVNLARSPVKDIISVSITAEKTVNIVHGIFSGAQDPLPDTSVLEILSVTQGATTYVETTDYLLTDGKVDWTPAGDEPAPSSTYSVTYRYITLTTPTDIDETGYTVTGAVTGTLILTTYRQMLPRIDRLCVNADGVPTWLIGVAAEFNPQPPAVPDNLLLLGSVYQLWNSQTSVVNDSVRVVPMPVLADIDNRIDLAMQLIAQQRLESSIHTREAGTKKGLFTDPFLDNSQRDAGIAQNAAIVSGMLMLPIDGGVGQVSNDIDVPATCAHTHAVTLSQPFRTGTMKINPYMAFALVPATVTLTPAVDRWTEVQTTWEDPITSRFTVNRTRPVGGGGSTFRVSTSNAMLSSSATALETLRQITVQFSISGFGVSEALQEVTFDGVDVTPIGLSADVNGNLSGSFTIPANIPSGSKEVVFVGGGGSEGSAIFSGQGTLERQVWQQQTRITTTRWISPPPPPPPPPPPRRFMDPLAQTFRMEAITQCSGVDLWFNPKPTTQTRVQIRETTVGFPNQTIVAEAILTPAQINDGGASTQVLFDSPVLLQGGMEYALVVLCNDAVGALSIAELGKYDGVALRWITVQPYTVGVLMSSSNAVSWSVHQDRDMAFRILNAQYSELSRTINLGSVAVTDATDLMLMGFAERPTSDANIEYTLTLPDTSTITVSDGQPIELAEEITGNVQIEAHLSMQGTLSPVLWPGTQLVSGTIATTANYVSRGIPAGLGSTVKAIFEAIVPSGANVEAFYSGIDEGDTWISLPVISTANTDDGFVEFVCEETLIDELVVRIKLELSGTAAARPYVRDLRVIVT